MTSKTIDISEDVYNKLLMIKGEKESISDLLLRLINEKNEILDKINTRSIRRWKKSIEYMS